MEICFIPCIITVDTLIILEVIKKYEINVGLMAGYLSVRTAGGESDRR